MKWCAHVSNITIDHFPLAYFHLLLVVDHFQYLGTNVSSFIFVSPLWYSVIQYNVKFNMVVKILSQCVVGQKIDEFILWIDIEKWGQGKSRVTQRK